MDPRLKLKSMEIAAQLLCCAQHSSGGDGVSLPSTRPVKGDEEHEEHEKLEPEWERFLKALFALSNRIANEALGDV